MAYFVFISNDFWITSPWFKTGHFAKTLRKESSNIKFEKTGQIPERGNKSARWQ